MLVELAIENLAVVESLRVEFAGGFTVLTGETGAGKSILIDALLLALGERADNSAIRSGFDRAQVEAVFAVAPESAAARWLAAQDIVVDEGLCVLRRTLHRDRASRCSVNGGVVTAGSLRELGRLLVDIHGQHAHQSLFQPGAQRLLLDQFAGLTTEVAKLTELYHRWSEQSNRLAEIDAREQTRADRLELVNYQLQELEGLAPEPGEWEQLDSELRRRSNIRSLAQTATLVGQALRGDEESLLDQLGRLTARLGEASRTDPALGDSHDLLTGAAIHAAEAAAALARYVDNIEFDEERTGFLEERVGRFHHLARKYHVAADDLHRVYDELAAERDTLMAEQAGRGELEQALDESRAAYDKLAKVISDARGAAAPRLTATTTDLARELGMPAAELLFEITGNPAAPPASYGADQVTILFSANPGEPPQPLSRVVSGGELSRLSLALHLTARGAGRPDTMIFDEVDAGIGGAIAHRVGACLRQLAGDHQVLCVTHQPQVAAQGDRHLGVRKAVQDGRTATRVVPLTDAERREEIARMLGGARTSTTTLQHAAELLDDAALG
ncbi:MAG: DNA repair protein RecN [Pseudomonadota bacterium]|nr:DNA repair protein RecN [Pseudomonadota bacterium]